MVTWSGGYKTLQGYKAARLNFYEIHVLFVNFLISLAVIFLS